MAAVLWVDISPPKKNSYLERLTEMKIPGKRGMIFVHGRAINDEHGS